MENLKELLTINPTSVTEDNLFTRFSRINKSLFEDYCIIKGEYRYEFVELEYYFYCDKHQDLITYQRKANAGDWFFHESGLDICFQSNANLEFRTNKLLETNEMVYFGGILIRGLKRIDDSGFHYFMGPQVCCNELFDQFSGIQSETNSRQYPYIARKAHSTPVLVNCGRYFEFNKKTDSEKFVAVGKKKWTTEPIDWPVEESTFKNLLKKKYRWYDSEKVEEWNNHKEGFSYSGQLHDDYFHEDYAEKIKEQTKPNEN